VLFALGLFGGFGFLVGTVLGAVFGRRRLALVLALAPVAGLVYLVWGLVAAPTAGHDCFECTRTAGRYVDILFFFVLATNVVGWWIGALLGAGGRALYRRNDSTRPSAT
jgi:hypothetical protein